MVLKDKVNLISSTAPQGWGHRGEIKSSSYIGDGHGHLEVSSSASNNVTQPILPFQRTSTTSWSIGHIIFLYGSSEIAHEKRGRQKS